MRQISEADYRLLTETLPQVLKLTKSPNLKTTNDIRRLQLLAVKLRKKPRL